jgi:hypothetical protein
MPSTYSQNEREKLLRRARRDDTPRRLRNRELSFPRITFPFPTNAHCLSTRKPPPASTAVSVLVLTVKVWFDSVVFSKEQISVSPVVSGSCVQKLYDGRQDVIAREGDVLDVRDVHWRLA